MKPLSLVLAAVQLFDLGLHVAAGQAEPLRLTANAAILLWVAGTLSGRLRAAGPPALAALAAYLGLNALFLTLEGVTNPAQGGSPRVMLFVLVALTVALSGALLYGHRRPRPA